MELNTTWKIVDLPSNKKPIGCISVYKIKYKADGSVERFKARLVANGSNQKEGIYYPDTFVTSGKYSQCQVCACFSIYKMLESSSNGVHNAFHPGDLNDEVYMTLPQAFDTQRRRYIDCSNPYLA